jgi:hypothetical protein
MTPEEISKLTNQELNELIAVKRGFHKEKNELWYRDQLDSLKTFYCQSFAPNYCGSWKLSGELLEEMPVETSLINFEDDTTGKQFWECKITNLLTGNVVLFAGNTSPSRAISEAWYLMECAT